MVSVQKEAAAAMLLTMGVAQERLWRRSQAATTAWCQDVPCQAFSMSVRILVRDEGAQTIEWEGCDGVLFGIRHER